MTQELCKLLLTQLEDYNLKRIIAIILSLALAISCCCASAFAASSLETRASVVLCDYNVALAPGNTSGKVTLDFLLFANTTADSIGIEAIEIYKSNGSYVKTITGTTGNGLIVTNQLVHIASYDCSLTFGVSYYAAVTFFTKAGSISDSRTITTTTVTAP